MDHCGFTEKEVFAALEHYGMSDRKKEVKEWYVGFAFGNRREIYNPWSIINYLDKKRIGTYWANTRSNSLVGKLIREGSPEIKMTPSLLLASGYLKVIHYEFNALLRKAEYTLKLTNLEVQSMFEQMIAGWFGRCRRVQNAFLQVLMAHDVKAMNVYMNKVTVEMFSYFDTGRIYNHETEFLFTSIKHCNIECVAWRMR